MKTFWHPQYRPRMMYDLYLGDCLNRDRIEPSRSVRIQTRSGPHLLNFTYTIVPCNDAKIQALRGVVEATRKVAVGLTRQGVGQERIFELSQY